MNITVYTKSKCPNCESAKLVLQMKDLKYTEVKIDSEADRLAFYAKCGESVRQMPQIYINDQRVGGLAGLQAALKEMSV